MPSRKIIKGKKIRNQVFYNMVFLIGAVIVVVVLCTVLQLPPDYILAVEICAPMALILLLGILFSFRKVLCILSDDRLYYFLPKDYGMEFTAVSGNKRKVLSQDGWILYSDIQRYAYLPRTRHLPTRVILYGSDFELKISGVGRRFIHDLEKLQNGCSFSCNEKTKSADAPSTQTVRSGLWKEIWEYCENGTLENMLQCDAVIRLESNENLDAIDILVNRAGHEIEFNIDDCSMYMYARDNGTNQTIYYEYIADAEDLFSHMRDFINGNSQ